MDMLKRIGLRNLAAGALILMLTAGSALAGSAKMNIDGKVGDTHLEAGRYKITWEQHSPEATVTVSKGDSVLATAEARVESRGTRFDRNSVIYAINADGSRSVAELHIGGTNTAIVFNK